MIYVEPALLTSPLLSELARQGKKSLDDLSMGLLAKAYQVYVVGTIIVLVEVRDGVLLLDAVLQTGKRGAYMRSLLRGLRKLARAWNLKRVETTSADSSIVKLLAKFGAKVDSVNMVLEI